jgi:hypothetical protein
MVIKPNPNNQEIGQKGAVEKITKRFRKPFFPKTKLF